MGSDTADVDEAKWKPTGSLRWYRIDQEYILQMQIERFGKYIWQNVPKVPDFGAPPND